MTLNTTEPPVHIDVRADHPGRNPHLRAGLVALAEYLTGLNEYPDPWELFHTLLPWRPDRKQVTEDAAELLRCVVARAASPGTFNPFDLELALDYLTGAR